MLPKGARLQICRKIFLLLFRAFFALAPICQYPRQIQHRHKRHKDHGDAQKVVAPHLLKEIEGISLLCLHQKHIVCVGNQIEDIDKARHAQKQEQRAPKVLQSRLDLTRYHKHYGIERKQDMYGKGMPMHKVGKGQFRPSRENQCKDRRRDTDAVQEIIKGLIGLKDVDRNHKNIDTAKVDRQIILSIVSEGDQNYDL